MYVRIYPNWHFASYSTWMRHPAGCRSPCGTAVQILATRSISKRTCSAPRRSSAPSRWESSIPLSPAPYKSLCLQLELFFVGSFFSPFFYFVLFAFVWFSIFSSCCFSFFFLLSLANGFCFMLDSMDFYVTAFWFRLHLRLSHLLLCFLSFHFPLPPFLPLISWLSPSLLLLHWIKITHYTKQNSSIINFSIKLFNFFQFEYL